MLVKEIMTRDPQCCTPNDTLQIAARLMADFDCGCLPILDRTAGNRLVGMLTDRDIAIRGVARGKTPDSKVNDVMSPAPTFVAPEDDVEVVEQIMIEKQVRRVPVVAADGRVVGIIAQADLAREDRAMSDREVGRIVEKISEPTSPRRTTRETRPEDRVSQ